MTEENKDKDKDRFDFITEKAKEVADNLIKAATDLASAVSEKAESVYGSAKKRFEIEKNQASLYKKYRLLGIAYYDSLKGKGGDDIEKLVEEIDAVLKTIEDLNAEAEKEEAEEAAAEAEGQDNAFDSANTEE